MADKKRLEDRFREAAIKRAVPYLNGIVPAAPSDTYSDRGLEVLWTEGYVHAREALIAAGEPREAVDEQMARVKDLLDIVEPSDLVVIPADLHDSFVTTLLPRSPPRSRSRSSGWTNV